MLNAVCVRSGHDTDHASTSVKHMFTQSDIYLYLIYIFMINFMLNFMFIFVFKIDVEILKTSADSSSVSS